MKAKKKAKKESSKSANTLLASASQIKIVGAKEHNLQEVDLSLPKGALIIFTGVSGSGKSSMAFETLYKEGQRRYLSAIGSQGREEQMAKPLVERIEGLSATVAIEQKSVQRQPRSLVGTLTQCYDFMRVLWAYEAKAYCPTSGESLEPQSAEQIVEKILERMQRAQDSASSAGKEKTLYLCASLEEHKKGSLQDLREQWLRAGFSRAFVDGNLELLEDEEWNLDPKKAHRFDLVLDRIKLSTSWFAKELFTQKARLREAVECALDLGEGKILTRIEGGQTAKSKEEQEQWSDSLFACSKATGKSYSALTPSDFSFNQAQGMCPKCHGLGEARDWILDRVIDQERSLAQGAIRLLSSPLPKRMQVLLHSLGLLHDFDLNTPWQEISDEAQRVILEGYDPPWVTLKLINPRTGRGWHERLLWRGVLGEAWQRYQGYTSGHAKKRLEPYLVSGICSACHGSRLAPFPSAARFEGARIAQVSAMSAREALDFFEGVKLEDGLLERVGPVLEQLKQRLRWMLSLGLDYLQLDRPASTLSGGESQRVRLCAHLGSGLTGVTYILDEPSIGLHARDNDRLIAALKQLRHRGNSVIVVEHDDATILSGDWIVDFGPEAGSQGGEVLYSGPPGEFLLHHQDRSLTARFLAQEKPLTRLLPPPSSSKAKKRSAPHLHLKGFSKNNIQNLSISVPLQRLVGITGVSGSGKSTLMHEGIAASFMDLLDRKKPPLVESAKTDLEIAQVVAIDQTPIGRLPRSNPATFVKLFDEIRSLFAQLPLARQRGYSVGRFSFNVREGSCARCSGMGYLKIDMDFMADEYICCPQCQGKQFEESTLDVTYKGLNIYEVLQLPAQRALELFADLPKIKKKLEILCSIGLGYLPLGHPSPYLSGGEAQRVKLAKELMRPPSKHTLYLLDEPTTGLHMRDVQKLYNLLEALVKLGHSVLVIEHHLDFLQLCDHLIEMGPEGGDLGGQCIASLSPQLLEKNRATPTGEAMARHREERASVLERLKKAAKQKEAHSLNAPHRGAIEVFGARQNNLKGCNLRLEHGKIHLITGPSGAGKSTLLQQTLYAHGLRQYSETLSAYARQFLSLPPEPKVERIEGMGPTVLVHGEHHSQNPRSTLGTVTECYDFLRLIFAHSAECYAPKTGRRVLRVDTKWLVEQLDLLPHGSKVQILAPLPKISASMLSETLERYLRRGFVRVQFEGATREIAQLLEQEQEHPSSSKKLHQLLLVIDRVITSKTPVERLYSSMQLAREIGQESVAIECVAPEGKSSIKTYHCGHCDPIDGTSMPPLSPQDFAFNHPQGWCSSCKGWGKEPLNVSTSKLRQSKISIEELLEKHLPNAQALMIAHKLCKRHKIDPHQEVRELRGEEVDLLLWGVGSKVELHAEDRVRIDPLSLYEGVGDFMQLPFGEEQLRCRSCLGSRLNERARYSFVAGKTLGELCQMTGSALLRWIEEKEPEIFGDQSQGEKTREKRPEKGSFSPVLLEPLKQVKERLRYLERVGLGYLPLHAGAPEMSLGERSRARLAKQLGAQLSDLCYLLDEVSFGLHPLDSQLLASSLVEFQEQGNTIVMADHNRNWANICEEVVEMGPEGGEQGGEICFQGTLEDYKRSSSPLAQALWRQKPPLKKAIRDEEAKSKGKRAIVVQGATAQNLKNISCHFPVGSFSIICGRSGSGKSSLLHDCLRGGAKVFLHSRKVQKGAEAKKSGEQELLSFHHCKIGGLEKIEGIEYVDSHPIGRSARADVGSYLEILALCRQIYAQLPLAKELGLQSKHFSPNTRAGMCKLCRGMGYRVLDLKFMPPTKTRCDRCRGMRLNEKSLQVHYKGISFGQLLQRSLRQTLELLGAWPKVKRICEAAMELGLGYLKLGEEIKRLSIGESQRLKLATALKKKHRSALLFLVDEPSKGLHPKDLHLLTDAFEALCEQGHTVIAVEHSPELIYGCDHLVELGPESGPAGGEVVYCGAPRDLFPKNHSKNSLLTPTARALKELFL